MADCQLVGLRVTLIFTAGGPPSALAAKAATSTIPIVFSAAGDPVGNGLVASLARPGGNVTGMSTLTKGLATKSIELMKELIPMATSVAFLVNPNRPDARSVSTEIQAAANAANIQVPVLDASTDKDLEAAFVELSKQRGTPVVVYGAPFFDSRREKIVALSALHKLPAAYAWREYFWPVD
jgi:putative ABC transport system substrate-binding protein